MTTITKISNLIFLMLHFLALALFTLWFCGGHILSLILAIFLGIVLAIDYKIRKLKKLKNERTS